MKLIYCIKCEKMVADVLTHFATKQVSNSQDPGDRWDLVYCDFPLGFTYCPPPEFDLDDYIAKFGNPPPVLEDFQPYTYEVERDEIVQEVYTV